MSRIFKIAAVAVAVLATAGTVAAQSPQRFSDVPASHPAHEAIEWAAVVGLTTGYEDGTFRPGVALSKRHAVVFMERFYDQILEAEESEGFTRADMMVLLKEMANQTPEPAATTAPPTSGIYFVDQYWSADGETYYVVIGNVDNLSYCEVHMTLNGRRTGDWGNEWWGGGRSEVTVAVNYVEFDADGISVECS